MHRFYSDTEAKAEAEEWGYIYGEVSTMALCSLTSQMSRKQRSLSKSKATVDAHWVCIMASHIVPMRIGANGYIHTRVGFCVARP